MNTSQGTGLTTTRIPFKRGSALLAILMFVAVLTLMLLSYLISMQMDQMSTNSYSHSIRAQEIGLGGLQEILDDLHSEINAGSFEDNTPTSALYTVNGTRIYVPTSNKAAVPARIGFAPADYGTATTKIPTSVIRASRAVDGFYTSPPAYMKTSLLPVNYASAVSSVLPSFNGRILTAERWNKPYLLGLNVPTSFYEENTLTKAIITNKTPDWVYVTRSGRRPCTDAEAIAGSLKADVTGTATNAVLGRYAYMMYDESALLDINVAGYPSSATTPAATPPTYTDSATGLTQAVGNKSYQSYADLTQLPGLIGKQAAVDKLLAWRNKGGLTVSGNNFLHSVFDYASKGFLSFQPGDSPILSRQDLIGYFTKLKENGDIANLSALQYLGTFNFAATGPTWMPTVNSVDMPGYFIPPAAGADPKNPFGGVYNVDYFKNIETPTVSTVWKTGPATVQNPNRNIANIRVADGTTTLLHYNDDGTSINETVKAGDAFLKRRFSLAKIKWLTHDGPATGKTQAVRDCFGLVWGTDGSAESNPCWTYTANVENGTPNRIYTLAEVAAQKREPNFFELLKAGILYGSLGRDPGATAQFNTAAYPYSWEPYGPQGSSFESASSIPDKQIIQIGANIIDQWDADSYPTAIYFKTQNPIALVGGPVNTVYGLENLPYLFRIFQNSWYVASDARFHGWLHAELWNPFQVPTVTTDRPAGFAVRAYGNSRLEWTESYGNNHTSGADDDFTPDPKSPPKSAGVIGTTLNYDTMASGESNDASIYFTDSIPSTFANPTVLKTANAGDYSRTKAINIAHDSPSDGGRPTPFVQFLGIHAGSAAYSWTKNRLDVGDSVAYNYKGAYASQIRPTIKSDPLITFCMQYYDGVRYLPYSYMSRVTNNVGYNYPPDGTDLLSNPIYGAPGLTTPFGHVDPLTDRFSAVFNDSSHGGLYPNGSGGGPYVSIVSQNINYQDTLIAPGGGINPYVGRGGQYGAPRPSAGFVHMHLDQAASIVAAWQRSVFLGNFAQNNRDVSHPGNFSLYRDPDGVARPGNDYNWNPGGAAEGYKNGDGMSQVLGGYSKTTGTGTAPTTTVGRRPLILNRPFRSVGELGYAYRDLPFKSLDFFSPHSADAGLLDLFCLMDETKVNSGEATPVVAGLVNPSNAPYPVIQAIIAGTSKQELDPANVIARRLNETDPPADAEKVALRINSLLNPASAAQQPLLNRADLVTRLMNSATGIPNSFTLSADKSNKTYMEAPIRALSAVTNTRTWNVMIDVIAQSGRMAPKPAGVKDFIVEGERRYWLHVSIDRYTGQILSQQLEPIYE